MERQFFLAPDGSSYSGRKQAVEYMNKHGYGQDDIKIMESGFKIQWIDDDPSLPEGQIPVVFVLFLTVKV